MASIGGPGNGSTRRPGAPLGLLGAFLAVALAELGHCRVAPEASSFLTASWSEAVRAAEFDARDASVLLLGDSQIKCGLQSRLLADVLGAPVVNLAVMGGQAASSDALLERALRAGARPRAVVVGFFPSLLASDLRINQSHWPEILAPLECLELCVVSRDARLLAPVMARSLLPSLRHRDAIHAALRARVLDDPEAVARRAKTRALRAIWQAHAGSHALPCDPNFRDEIPLPSRGDDPNAARNWRARPENLAYVRRFLTRAQSAGIPVFWLLPTTAPALRTAHERDGRAGAMHAWIRRLQGEFPGLTVLDPRAAINDPAGFADVHHLTVLGASALSLSVARELRRRLDDSLGAETDSWVSLQPTRGEEVMVAEARLAEVVEVTARHQRVRERTRR